MLPRTLFHRTLLSTTSTVLLSPRLVRASSSTTTPPKMSYTLDPSLFNQSLYTSLHNLWFADLSPSAKTAPLSTLQRWFSFNLSQEEKDAFDERCWEISASALEALGPDRIELPPQAEKYEAEVAQAPELARPLLEEVEAAGNEGERAERLLSLVLLLDQMLRNIYRTRTTLPLAYRHYDRLALSLIHLAMKLEPTPLLYKPFLSRPVVGTWLLMPFTHSESLAAHESELPYAQAMERVVKAERDEGALAYLGKRRGAEAEHREVLERIRRYPQRNQGLGRVSTSEEKEWLKKGGGFGVKQEDEGQVEGKEKDEL